MSHCGFGWMQAEELDAGDWESVSDEDDDFLQLATQTGEEFGTTNQRVRPEAAPVQQSIPGEMQ